MYSVYQIKNDFPIFKRKINNKSIVYLDTAASAQKPQCVIDKIINIYQNSYANVHRGIYDLSEEITFEYEQSRQSIADFINADSKEIIFTRNATESINLVASSWADNYLNQDDEILISEAEHHANLIPWQIVSKKKGCKLKVFKIGDDGSFLENEFLNNLSSKTKLIAITAMSNVLGTIFPIKKIVKQAHQIGAKVLIDACQFIVHKKLDVKDIDCDFLVFSGHKLYGPTGIGVLYGKNELLNNMRPYQTGGDMVDKVTYQNTYFLPPPARFEAGTPAIVQAIALASAIQYIKQIGPDNIEKHENELVKYMYQRTMEIKDFKHIGNIKNKGGVFAFQVANIHPQDLAYVLNKEGVSIRIGHHCAEPLVNRMGYNSLARASFGLYTTKEDIDSFVNAVNKAMHFFNNKEG